MNIQVISTDKPAGQAVLVEWRDSFGAHRCYLPTEIVKPDVPLNVLQAGVPFGINWEDAPIDISAQRVARALRARGLWTQDDLQSNVSTVHAALQDIVSELFTDLLKFARTTRQED